MAAFYTLLYVAPITDAESIALHDADEGAMNRYPNAWLRHVGDEELVALWDVLDTASNQGTLMGDLAYASPDGEVIVMTVPKEFVVALAAADPEPVDTAVAIYRTHATMVAGGCACCPSGFNGDLQRSWNADNQCFRSPVCDGSRTNRPFAAVQRVQYLVTWNFKHIANATMRSKIEQACRDAGFDPPIICSPPEIPGDTDD